MNRYGKAELTTVILWVAILGVIAYFGNFGGFKGTVDGWLGTSTPGAIGGAAPSGGVQPGITRNLEQCPTDGTTTYSVNIQDALTTTATSRYPEYFVFNGNGLVKEGTLSSTSSTFSVDCGNDYKLLLINTTAKGDLSTASGAYPQIVDLKARTAQQTVNAEIYTVGQAKINKLINPVETAGSTYYNNMSLGASTTKDWQIQFGANYTQRAYNRPLILCEVNNSEIQTMDLNSFDDGKVPSVATIPKRITTSEGRAYYAWEYPGMLDPAQGIVVGSGTLTSASTMAATQTAAQNMTCMMADQQMWKTAGYKTASTIDSAFSTGAENTETLGDVGGPDTASVYMYFVNANE